jgi:surface protein
MEHFNSYKKKFDSSQINDDEVMRKYMLRMLEEEFRAFEAVQNAEASASAVASAGGGQSSSGPTPPPFGVNEFITTWKTDNAGVSASNQIQLPLGVFSPSTGYNYYFQVDWGDGSKDIIQSASDPARTHTYASSGTYTVKISGVLDGWSFNNGYDRLKMLAITQWGMMKVGTYAQFAGCANLQVTATDLPTLISMGGTFWNCTALTNVSRIAEWDVTGVTDMFQCFRGCSAFNDDVTGWNVSNLTIAFRLFMSCSSFNRNLSSWNTGKIQYFTSMFNAATSFTNGGSTGINNWDTSSVLSIEEMFRGASSFNQPIGNWDMSKVTNMRSVFRDSPFTQDIGAWNTGNVTTMADLFLNNGSNQNLANWDFRKVTLMSRFSFGLSTANYNAILLNLANSSTLVSNVPLQVNAQYSTTGTGNKVDDPAAARAYVIATYNWTITDGGLAP